MNDARVRSSLRSPDSVGALLQHWRNVRNLSQLSLASEAEISPRHLSFVETGRAKPSREMVLLLAAKLDVPLRDRNMLLLAAGFAPAFTESQLDAPELVSVKNALDAILRQQEPFPAVVMNRHWDIVQANRAATRFFGFLLAFHSTMAQKEGVDAEDVGAIRERRLPQDTKLAALSRFTRALIDKRGHVDEHDLASFTGAG